MTKVKTLPIKVLHTLEKYITNTSQLFLGEVKEMLSCDDVISEDDKDSKERLESSVFNLPFNFEGKTYHALWTNPTGWIITKQTNDDGNIVDANIIGPRGCTLTREELIQGHQFRMLDDDKNVMFIGFLMGDHESEDGFAPLDNYGQADAGCTTIQYKYGNSWKTL